MSIEDVIKENTKAIIELTNALLKTKAPKSTKAKEPTIAAPQPTPIPATPQPTLEAPIPQPTLEAPIPQPMPAAPIPQPMPAAPIPQPMPAAPMPEVPAAPIPQPATPAAQITVNDIHALAVDIASSTGDNSIIASINVKYGLKALSDIKPTDAALITNVYNDLLAFKK